MIRVVIIEDDPNDRFLYELEINKSPGLKCIASFENFEPASVDMFAAEADVVLLDLGLRGGMDGVTACAEIKTRWRFARILVLSMNEDPATIISAFEAGARGYLLKIEPREKIAEGIKRVHEGGTALSAPVANALVSRFEKLRKLLPDLSPTEKNVLRVLQYLSYKEAADQLGMSINTVKTHAKRILEKSLARSIGEAHWLRKAVV